MRGWARATGVVALAVVALLTASPPAGGVEPTGSITGKVTAWHKSDVAIENTRVCAQSSGGAEACVFTDRRGEYVIDGLVSGEYKVSFIGGQCVEGLCGLPLLIQYYDYKLSQAKADPVWVHAPEAATGIDAQMENEGERPIREYLEDETPAQPYPVETATGPGAIAPPPVNKKLEEEFLDKPVAAPAPVAGSAIAGAASAPGPEAMIALRCIGSGPCVGSAHLATRIASWRIVERRGKRLLIRHVRNVNLGTGTFSLRPGASGALRIRLSAIAQHLVKAAGKTGLRVQLSGVGVRSATLILR